MLAFAFFGALALLLENYYLLCIPFGGLVILTSIDGIEVLFFFLILLIPVSIEQKITTTISTDFPDEILMWLITTITWVVFLFNKNLRLKIIAIRNPIWILMSLLVLWLLVTTAFSSNLFVSFKHFLSKCWYLTCFFVLPVLIFSKAKHIKLIFQILLFSMLFVVAYAFVKQVGINFSFLRVNEAVRPFFRNHVNYSALLACFIPLMTVAIFNTKSQPMRIFLGIAICICTINIIFAFSRGAWLGLLCCPFFYFILKRKSVKPFLIAAITLLSIGVFIFISTGAYKKLKPNKKDTIYHTDIKDHLKATYQLTDMSFAERFYRWTGGINMTKARPIFGFGPNTFNLNYKAYTISDFQTWVSANKEKSSIHNYYLLQFAEQGILGGIIFLMLIYYAFIRIEQLYHSRRTLRPHALGIGFILVVICIELLVNDLIETDKIGSIFYLSLAGIIVLEKTPQDAKKLSKREL